jgi:hypothetical protein
MLAAKMPTNASDNLIAYQQHAILQHEQTYAQICAEAAS